MLDLTAKRWSKFTLTFTDNPETVSPTNFDWVTTYQHESVLMLCTSVKPAKYCLFERV